MTRADLAIKRFFSLVEKSFGRKTISNTTINISSITGIFIIPGLKNR
jgi:hypothetical protein